MKKILLATLCTVTAAAYADDYSKYQAFDNQFNLNYSYNVGTLEDSTGNTSTYGYSTLGLEVERIMDFGLWFDLNASLMLNYDNFSSSNPNANMAPIGQAPNVGDFITKAGYALPMNQQLLLIPYGQFAKNTNMTSNSFKNNTTGSGDGTYSLDTNVTNDYYLGLGIGGRAQYLFNDMFSAYFDQNVAYNIDMSGPNSTYSPSNNWSFTSQLGLKANVYKSLQLFVAGSYDVYVMNVTNSNMIYQLYPSDKFALTAGIGMTY